MFLSIIFLLKDDRNLVSSFSERDLNNSSFDKDSALNDFSVMKKMKKQFVKKSLKKTPKKMKNREKLVTLV